MQKSQRVDIVIIDDNRHQLDFISHMLDINGYTSFALQQSSDALKIISEKNPKLIILDILMPDMDGFSVLKSIRNDPQFKDLPIIIYSGKTFEVDRKKALELGANSYINKPAKSVEIINEIKKYI